MSESKRRMAHRINDQGQDEGQPQPQDPRNSCAVTVEDLPPEVLEMIFKNVESPKDLLNCWNTTPAWANALRSIDSYFKMTLPFVLPYLARKDLLQCSSVSKSWNGAVDACIQNAEEFGSSSRLKPEQRIVFELGNYNRLTRFLNTFTLTNEDLQIKLAPTNPVAFRRVLVQLSGHPVHPRPFNFELSKLQKCLNHHGHLIRNLNIYCIKDGSLLNAIKSIRSCMERTPNLHVLGIPELEYVASAATVIDKKMEDSQLEALNECNSWPELKHLKVLKIGDRFTITHKEYACIVNAYGPQLLYLKFGFELMDHRQLLPGRFSKLRKIVYFINNERSGIWLGAFLQSNQCPLKQLDVMFQLSPDEENYDGLNIAVNAASATLESLYFCAYCSTVCSHNNFDITKFEQMRLPRLKVLKLDYFGYPGLEFLQTVCPALQMLTVSPSLSHLSSDNRITYDILEHGDIYGDLYSQHQLWKELADIKCVDVEYLVYAKNQGKMETKIISKNEATRERQVYTRFRYESRQRRSKMAVAKAQSFLLNRNTK